MEDTQSAPESPQNTPPSDSGQVSPNRTIMIVLAYFGILALVPLLVETDDAEVQWHAKHGLVLFATWIVVSIALAILTMVPVVGWMLGCGVTPFLWLLILIVHIMAIVKGVKGERLRLPVVTEYADQWK